MSLKIEAIAGRLPSNEALGNDVSWQDNDRLIQAFPLSLYCFLSEN